MPYIVFDFSSNTAFLDVDRDGCADRSEQLPQSEIDPAEYISYIGGSDDLCYEATIG